MTIGLLVVDPITAVVTFFVFSLVVYFLYRFMHLRAETLGIESSSLNIRSNEKIVEVFASYRESVVRNRRDYYAREIGQLRYSLANSSAEIGFLPYVSKYVIETTVVVAAVLIGALQFALQDASHAIATLAIFLAAGTRIAPAVLRLQQGTIYIKNGLGLSLPTLDLLDTLGNAPMAENVDDSVDAIHDGFISEIVVESVKLTYPGRQKPAIEDVSLIIPAGSSIAFVGPSGAGKTSIVDVILGVIPPTSGTIHISGLSPLDAISKWPGGLVAFL
jgi:ABC-type multidrug transport system fused ATPase/permease subunit